MDFHAVHSGERPSFSTAQIMQSSVRARQSILHHGRVSVLASGPHRDSTLVSPRYVRDELAGLVGAPVICAAEY